MTPSCWSMPSMSTLSRSSTMRAAARRWMVMPISAIGLLAFALQVRVPGGDRLSPAASDRQLVNDVMLPVGEIEIAASIDLDVSGGLVRVGELEEGRDDPARGNHPDPPVAGVHHVDIARRIDDQ